jgi:Na+/serine symporter
MGLLSDLNAVQWTMIGVPLGAMWIHLIATIESNGKRQPLLGLLCAPLFIPLLVALSPVLLMAIIKDGVVRRRLVQVVVTTVILFLLGGYVATIVAVRDRPPPAPADLPVERG